MLTLISIEKFAESTMKSNPNQYKKADLITDLQNALNDKKNGAKCCVCGNPIWAAGSAITGTNMCFTCTTGESDDSEDYEITQVGIEKQGERHITFNSGVSFFIMYK